MNDRQPQNFWPPLAAGIGLGLALMGMFLFTGHGLGANGFFTRLSVWLADMANPAWATANAYFKSYFGKGHPLDEWISWEIIGVAFGALAGSLTARCFQWKIERGPRIGFNARSTLAVAAFVFLIAFFAAGLLLSALTRRLWQ